MFLGGGGSCKLLVASSRVAWIAWVAWFLASDVAVMPQAYRALVALITCHQEKLTQSSQSKAKSEMQNAYAKQQLCFSIFFFVFGYFIFAYSMPCCCWKIPSQSNFFPPENKVKGFFFRETISLKPQIGFWAFQFFIAWINHLQSLEPKKKYSNHQWIVGSLIYQSPNLHLHLNFLLNFPFPSPSKTLLNGNL